MKDKIWLVGTERGSKGGIAEVVREAQQYLPWAEPHVLAHEVKELLDRLVIWQDGSVETRPKSAQTCDAKKHLEQSM